MSVQKSLTLLVCAWLLSSSAQAAPQPSTPRTSSAFVDVALQPAGGVAGRFIDSQGDPVGGATATLFRGETAVATSLTGADGTYHFPSVVPGVYRVRLEDQWQLIRVWDEAIRPPAARNLLTIVRQERIVRGQQISESLVGQIGLGVGLAGSIGAGVAISQSLDAQEETADLRRRLLKVTSP